MYFNSRVCFKLSYHLAIILYLYTCPVVKLYLLYKIYYCTDRSLTIIIIYCMRFYDETLARHCYI